MQDALFPDDDQSLVAQPEVPSTPTRRRPASEVAPASVADALQALASGLPAGLRLGTSSWSFPGWDGLVWDGAYSEAQLAKRGLTAYARHPLLRTVSLDRAFYQPLTLSQYVAYAAQVPEHFRFVVKAPSVVADALVRNEDGRGMRGNPAFLDPALAQQAFVEPAVEGLGAKAGVLVFQLSPLPGTLLARMPEQLERLARMLQALPLARLRQTAPELVVAVEVRNAEWLTPAFAAMLRACGATYCLGQHAKLPPVDQQLPVLRALWPGPLVCRWNLNSRHGAFGYEDAKALYAPFDRLVDPDPDTRAVLVRVIAATLAAGQLAYLTVNNKAEGSAPLTVAAMARLIAAAGTPR